MMDDVIYRKDAIDAIKGLPTWWADGGGYYGGAQPPMEAMLEPNDVISAIDNLPSAQKKGRWRNYEGILTCSVCEAKFDNGIMEYCGDDVPIFCPNCGADMRESE